MCSGRPILAAAKVANVAALVAVDTTARGVAVASAVTADSVGPGAAAPAEHPVVAAAAAAADCEAHHQIMMEAAAQTAAAAAAVVAAAAWDPSRDCHAVRSFAVYHDHTCGAV